MKTCLYYSSASQWHSMMAKWLQLPLHTMILQVRHSVSSVSVVISLYYHYVNCRSAKYALHKTWDQRIFVKSSYESGKQRVEVARVKEWDAGWALPYPVDGWAMPLSCKFLIVNYANDAFWWELTMHTKGFLIQVEILVTFEMPTL